jgi:hypothetical protein
MVVVVRSRAGSVGHKVVPGLIALAAASVTCLAVTACGGSGAGGSARPAVTSSPADPLASLSGDQIVAKAVAELKAVPSFTMAGTVTDSSGTYNVNLSYKKGSGCQGTVAQPSKGSFAMVVIGTTAWVKPDDAFWTANVGGQAAKMITLQSGRYLKGSTSNAKVASLTKPCDVSSLPGSFAEATGVAKGPVTVMGGQRVLPLTDKAKGGTLYVTDASPPRILQLSNSKAGDHGKLTFSYTPVTLTPPPASQAVDGSKLGF